MSTVQAPMPAGSTYRDATAAVAVDPCLVTTPSWWVALDARRPAVIAGPIVARAGGGRSTY